MTEAGVQTDDFVEDELDWDLSDRVDRETQTLPPNATRFQRNRVEAIVQTDFRYFPLALHGANSFEARESKEMVDAGTQTEQTKSSVSTQTECLASRTNSHIDLPFSAGGFTRNASKRSLSSNPERKELNGVSKSSSVFESLEPQNVLPLVTSPLVPNPISVELEYLENPSGDSSSPSESEKKDALELWRRLAPFALDELMPSFKMTNKAFKRIKRMIDVSIQTENDITDLEDPYIPQPPTCTKSNLLRRISLSDIDLHVLTTPPEVAKDPKLLVEYLCGKSSSDLHRVRVIFRWIAENISYDWKFAEKRQSVDEILDSQRGAVKDYVNLFCELCFLVGIKVKTIYGFARGYSTKVGKSFVPGEDPLHSWVVVFIEDSWRFVDPTWGSGYIDEEGRFKPSLEEHFFLPDPNDFILTHFPWVEHNEHYERWQLLEEAVPLGEFNLFPKVTPNFCYCKLRLRRPKCCPVIFNQQTEIQVASSILLKYRFNFHKTDEPEEEACNEWVFCQMKEGGVVGSFLVVAPSAGSFYLKVYAKSDEIQEDEEEDLDLPHAFTFLLECTKARRYPVPWPIHEGAWGPTPRLYECGLDPVNQSGPIINAWGGRKLLYFEKMSDVLLMLQIFDSDGIMLETKGTLKKDESEDQIRISIVPPAIGFFKLLIYGMPRPQIKGRWKLPLLASYLIECKMSIITNTSEHKTETKKQKPKKKLMVARR